MLSGFKLQGNKFEKPSGNLPVAHVIYLKIILFNMSLGGSDQAVMEVQNLRPSYWKFLLRLTKGRCVLVENLID